MANEEVPKLDRIVQLPKLENFKDLVKWSRDFNAAVELRLSTMSSKVNDKVWQLIYEIQLEATIASFNIPHLDGDNQREYLLMSAIKCNHAPVYYYAQPNVDQAANYGFVTILGNGAAASSSASAVSTGFRIGYSTGLDYWTFSTMHLFAKSGMPRHALIMASYDVNGASIGYTAQESGSWNNTADNITSLQIHSGHPNNPMGIGSRFVLWTR